MEKTAIIQEENKKNENKKEEEANKESENKSDLQALF